MFHKSFSSDVYEQVPDLKYEKVFGDVDLLWANFICHRAAKPSVILWITCALLNQCTHEGNSYLPLDVMAKKNLLMSPALYPLPALDLWKKQLMNHPDVVGNPKEYKPLLLYGSRLYLHRMHAYETTLTAFIKDLSTRSMDRSVMNEAKSFVRSLGGGVSPEQKIALYLGLTRYLTVLAGGPGTGKTFTLRLLMTAYAALHHKTRSSVFLLAPTGKAVLRLKEALNAPDKTSSSFSRYPANLHLEEEYENVQTVDMFLRRRARILASHRIGMVILDETSMVSLRAFYNLVQALKKNKNAVQYVLVGDPNQLASIEAATLMHDLTQDSHYTPYTGSFIEEIGSFIKGDAVLSKPHTNQNLKRPCPFRDNVVTLETPHRYTKDSSLYQLTTAIHRQDFCQVMDLLRSDRHPNISLEETSSKEQILLRLEHYLLKHYQTFYATFSDGDHRQAFINFFEWGILCPVRWEPLYGMHGINLLIQKLLFESGTLTKKGVMPLESYTGIPLMVLENDYALKVFNGDVGFILPPDKSKPNETYVGFLNQGFGGDDHAIREHAFHRLPKHETCYATTVHKSQGSEYKNVLLILPQKDSPILTKEILYTALSRAKEKVVIIGSETLIEKMLNTPIKRYSGMGERLWKP